MTWRTGKRRVLLTCVLLALFSALLAVGVSELLLPKSTKNLKKNGDLTVDIGNASEGYIMACGKKSGRRMKLRVRYGNDTLTYDLNGGGDYEVFPLQYGSGEYTVILYQNTSGKRYTEEGRLSFTVKMQDELRCFLYPNQYVNYDEKTKAVAEAEKLCAGLTGQREIYDAVVRYIKENFKYDYMKSSRVQPGQLPQIGEAWDKKMGICQDLAAITVAMLRSRGVPARLMIGYLGNTYHAWVTAVVDGTEQFFDPTVEIGGARNGMEYTLERYY
ncbi:MAG: transglutaminase family protein [Clostridia bacterium]|nr:transglutaminase family protein [Clostridia bacterium]